MNRCYLIFILILIMLMVTGCGNPYTPAGHEGYVQTVPLLFGQGGFSQVIKGPRKLGMSWRKEIQNIDMRPQTYVEEFKILTTDDLNISFRFHAILSLKEGGAKDIVEKYDGVNWYKRFVQEQLRTAVRTAVQSYTAIDAKKNKDNISATVGESLTSSLKATPIIIVKLLVGNIDYPPVITQAVEKKLAAAQLLQEKETQKAIAQKDAEIKIEEAKGIAKAQEIINKTLTTNYLQHEAIEAQKLMASSPNHTTVYIPVGNNGVPLVTTTKK